MLKHIVMYRFPEASPQEKIDEIFDLLSEAHKQVPGMTVFSHGKNVLDSPKTKGFNYGFVMDFTDQDSYQEYLDHQNHLDVRVLVRKLIQSEDDIFEIDYHYE